MKLKHLHKIQVLAAKVLSEADWLNDTSNLEFQGNPTCTYADLCSDYKDLVIAVEELGVYLVKRAMTEM